MELMSQNQIVGLQNAPQRHVRRLASTALHFLQQVDELTAQVRQLQESRAESDKQQPVLIVLNRDGFVEVFARQWLPLHIVCRPDLGSVLEEEADKYVLDHCPWQYRELLATDVGKRIATGNTRCCLTLSGWKVVELTKEKLAACWLEKALQKAEVAQHG